MSREVLREQLLSLMDRKSHWAWPDFAQGKVPLDRLLPHFQQEWEVYVRDFPVLLARILGKGPPAEVRESLAGNIYEEQTGGISGTAPHPELFLQMMKGCGYAPQLFEGVQLGPAARRYRRLLDETTTDGDWVEAAAMLTIFVEGSVNERQELAAQAHSPPTPAEIEESIQKHPLVRVHRVDPAAMELVRVHRKVEGGHRKDAWDAILNHAQASDEAIIKSAVEEALELWLAFRDEVAMSCGLLRRG